MPPKLDLAIACDDGELLAAELGDEVEVDGHGCG
jgi:hypothetical protein